MFASAATRSAIEGSSFGKAIEAGLPDVIGQVVGQAIAGGVETVSRNIKADRILDDLPDVGDRAAQRSDIKKLIDAGWKKDQINALYRVRLGWAERGSSGQVSSEAELSGVSDVRSDGSEQANFQTDRGDQLFLLTGGDNSIPGTRNSGSLLDRLDPKKFKLPRLDPFAVAQALEAFADASAQAQVQSVLENYDLDPTNETHVLAASSYVWASHKLPFAEFFEEGFLGTNLIGWAGSSDGTNAAAAEAVLSATLVEPRFFLGALVGREFESRFLLNIGRAGAADVLENRDRPQGVSPSLQANSFRYRRLVDTGLREGKFWVHHLIPVELVAKYATFFERAADAGWKTDHASNLIGLPADQTAFELAGGTLPIHNTNHKEYTRVTENGIRTMIAGIGGDPTGLEMKGILRIQQAYSRRQILTRDWHDYMH